MTKKQRVEIEAIRERQSIRKYRERKYVQYRQNRQKTEKLTPSALDDLTCLLEIVDALCSRL
jgi:hypothetical protein